MTKFVASISPIQSTDVIVTNIQGNSEATMDAVYDAIEVDGEIFVIHSDIAVAEQYAATLNREFGFEVVQLADNIRTGAQTIANLRDKGVADDVILMIEAEVKESKTNNKGEIQMGTENKQDPEVVAMMKAAGIEIGQSLNLALGTVKIVGFNATGEGVMVSVEVNGVTKEIHAKDLVEFKKEATTMEGSVKVAFEGTSQVPTSQSAEDQALANIANEAKNTINKETKGAEVEMTNVQTNEQQVVALTAAQKFYQKNAAKLKDAVKAPEQKEEVKVEETKTEEKEVGNVGVIGAVKLGNGFEKNTNTKEEKEMTNTTTETKGRENVGVNAGGTAANGRTTVGVDFNQAKKDAKPANMRVGYDESVRGSGSVEKSVIPYYLDVNRYPVMADLAEILMHRQYAPLGITAMKNLNPEKELAYANDKIVALVEMVLGAVSLRFRIQMNNNEKSNSDLSSTNIAWEEKWNPETFRKELQPVYSFYRKNTMLATIKCCGTYMNDVAVGDKVKCEKCGKEHVSSLVINHSEGTAGSDATASQYTRQNLGNFNIEIQKDVLALALAFAQFNLGLDMHGTLTVEQEDAILDVYGV